MEEQPPLNQQKKTYKVTVRSEWCKKCGICIAFCPKAVFKADTFGLSQAQDPNQCIGCMLCVIRCPDFCIKVEPLGSGAEQPKEAGS